MINNLREAERSWVDWLKQSTELNETAVLDLLERIHIDMIGLEDDLNNRALRLLEPIFGHATQDAWSKIKNFVADKDGVVKIEPGALWVSVATLAS